MTLTAAQQEELEASLPPSEQEYTVEWKVDEWGTSPEDAAFRVAKTYFQERIARGENGSACLFYVDGKEVPLDWVMSEMSPEGLAKHFDHEHPVHTRVNWVYEVKRSETISGYWEWVKHQLTL
ncbi:hypothetical protein [Pseudomonas sp.]|uniref:hypothetical protein n=1 Tax=Pseudomonas sp. TaxID=306 RepID=UPI003FD802B6